MPNDTDTDNMVSNAFSQFLTKHRRGQAANEASAALQEAIIAACDTGKQATVTVTVKIDPKGSDQVQMAVDIKTKLPKQAIQPSMFWVEEGQLFTSDPKQAELPLREVTLKRPERSVERAAGE